MSRDTLEKYNLHKVKAIINRLIDATKSGYCKWEVNRSNSSGKYGKPGVETWYIKYKSTDGETEYKVGLEVKDGKFVEDSFAHIWIINENLPNRGQELFSAYELNMEREIKEFMKILYKDFVSHKFQENVVSDKLLDKIFRNVNKVFTREKKLNSIMGEDVKKKESDIKGIIKRKKWFRR